mgnify:CR=1 FL=1
MNILIDADGCPVVDLTLQIAKRFGVPVIILCDTAHQIEREGAQTLVFDKGADSVDFALVSRVKPGDVVVTQDIGLASMVLGRDAAAIGVRGRVYDKATIDMQLFIRHEEKKVRRAGGRTRGPAAFTSEDRARFKRNLTELLR